jgi:membrane protein required for colicin V production
MSVLDIIILVILLIGAIRGYFTGFLIQIFSLVALFAAIWIGIKYNTVFAAYLKKVISVNDSVLPYVSFILFLVLVVLIVTLIAWLLTKAIDKSALGTLNRICGALFGVVKMVILVGILILVMRKTDKKETFLTKVQKEESYLYQPIEKIALVIFPPVDFGKLKNEIINLEKR